MNRRSRGCCSTLRIFGRRARTCANRSAVNGPYRPATASWLRTTSRATVDGDRPNCTAIVRNDNPWAMPSAIRSRSASDRYRREVDLGDLPARLERAKREGLANVGEIVNRYAVARGWPAGLAMQYLSVYLKFDVGPREMHAIAHFHRLAADHGAIGAPAREVEVYGA